MYLGKKIELDWIKFCKSVCFLEVQYPKLLQLDKAQKMIRHHPDLYQREGTLPWDQWHVLLTTEVGPEI